jgi:hypothetical protein
MAGDHPIRCTTALIAFGLGLALAFTLGACLPLPGPSFSRVVQAPVVPMRPPAPGDGLAVLATGGRSHDDDSTTACVREALLRRAPALRLVPSGALRDTALAALDNTGVTSDDLHGFLVTQTYATASLASGCGTFFAWAPWSPPVARAEGLRWERLGRPWTPRYPRRSGT